MTKEAKHRKTSNAKAEFVNDVLNLSKRLLVDKPSRTEPTLQVSEFNLVKSGAGNLGEVHVNELTEILKKRAKHVDIRTKVNKARRKAKTLSKPLEKPQADRIKRSVAFRNAQKQLSRWDAVVTSNRASARLSFPLPQVKLSDPSKPFDFRLKSDLQKDLEALEPKVEVFNLEKDAEYPMSLQEMQERRKEMAKMRALQSYKEAKARRQSKIKSKKYHRIQRRERIKSQLKEFELLQQTDPAAALRKLEQIEKVRAEERASLRHRSTGKWARNKQVQAKYDKHTRQVLAQQLALSRDLTLKTKPNNDSESEGEVDESKTPKTADSNNPWTSPNKVSGEVQDFISGYRKFWENVNKGNVSSNDVGKTTQVSKKLGEEIEYKIMQQTATEKKPKDSESERSTSNTKKTQPKRKRKISVGTTSWEISSVAEDKENTDDDIIENLDKTLRKNLKTKLDKVQKELDQQVNHKESKRNKKSGKSKLKQSQSGLAALSFSPQARHPELDEELLENCNDSSKFQDSGTDLTKLEAMLQVGPSASQSKEPVKNIDPTDIIKVKPVNLDTEIPDMLMVDDDEEHTDQRDTIMEAFQDDDVVEEFSKDKQAEINKDKPQDVNLALPGWGSWGGAGVKMSKLKSKRFILKFPKEFKRRDDNKRHLIINEKANRCVKPHMVSEVPFPFKKVKDFEASIRAPISNTFVPETAYRRLIRPTLTTKMGTIIEPMTEDVLLKKKK